MNELLHGAKVLIAEDHELYNHGLKLLIEEMSPCVQVKQAYTFSEIKQQLLENSDISLLLLDIRMPGNTGLNAITEIRHLFPSLIIVVISTLDFEVSVRQVIQLGANGFLAKSTPKHVMQSSIEEILRGSIIIKSETEGASQISLSSQQLATLGYLAEGLTNKAIANRLNISPFTVKEYVSTILERLGAANRTQAVLIAQRQGLLLDHLF